MADKGLIYMVKSIGIEPNAEEHLSVQEQNQSNYYIERHSVYDQSDKMVWYGLEL